MNWHACRLSSSFNPPYAPGILFAGSSLHAGTAAVYSVHMKGVRLKMGILNYALTD